MANFPVGIFDDVCDAFFHAIKAFTTARDFKTADLKAMPGHLRSEDEARREELLEEWQWENDTRIGDGF